MDNPNITYHIDKKLNGYRATHRNKWRFVQHGLLNVQELTLLEFYADIMNFDKRYPEYATITTNFTAMAIIFNKKSDTTIRNWHDKLLELGFIEATEQKNVFRLKCAGRYVVPGFWKGEASNYVTEEKNQPFEKLLQNFGLESQKIEQTTQIVGNKNEEKTETTSKPNSRALISSKNESSIGNKRVVIRQEARSDEEYQRIFQEGNFQGLTPDDMKWIDENVSEVKEVEDDEMEKDIVDIYFDGDFEKYKHSLITKHEYATI